MAAPRKLLDFGNFHEQRHVIRKLHINCSTDGAMLSKKQSLFYIRSSGQFHSENFVEITMKKNKGSMNIKLFNLALILSGLTVYHNRYTIELNNAHVSQIKHFSRRRFNTDVASHSSYPSSSAHSCRLPPE